PTYRTARPSRLDAQLQGCRSPSLTRIRAFKAQPLPGPRDNEFSFGPGRSTGLRRAQISQPPKPERNVGRARIEATLVGRGNQDGKEDGRFPYCGCDTFGELKRTQESSQGPQVICTPKLSPGTSCVRGCSLDLGWHAHPVPVPLEPV